VTTAYNPRHNGRIERMHRSLKNSIRSRLDGRTNWLSELPWALLGIRNAPNTDTGVSPAELVFGERLNQPGEPDNKIIETEQNTFANLLKTAIAAQTPKRPEWHKGRPNSYVPKELDKCEKVLVRRDRVQPGLRPKYDGPFTVKERHNKFFRIQIDDNDENIGIDRLKPFFQ
ncbi:Transposon Ty3-G Gag-Pol poly, partial [Paramuricea clavata]